MLPWISLAQHSEQPDRTKGLSMLAFRQGKLSNELYEDQFLRILVPSDDKIVSEKLTEFYMSWIYPTRTLDACSKGDTLGSIYWATVTNPSFPADFAHSERVLRDTANVISSFTVNDKTIYVHAISVQGELCNCMYTDFQGKLWPIAMPVKSIQAQPINAAERKRLASMDLKKFYESYLGRSRN